MPGKTDLSELNCSLARTLEIVGDWWTLLIIRDAFLGVRRFGDFQKSLGIAKNILATRLERLCENDILERGGSEKRPLYRSTDKGRGLVPAMVALMQWGDKWASDGKPPVIVTDQQGRALAPVKLQGRGGDVDVQSVRFSPGPGATARTRAFFDALSPPSGHSPAPNKAGLDFCFSGMGLSLLLERSLQAVELRHQRVADRGPFRRRGMDRGVEPAHLSLQAHRARNQILQLLRELFDHVLSTGIGGRELDLGLFPIGLAQRHLAFLDRAMQQQPGRKLHQAGGEAHAFGCVGEADRTL